MKAKRTFFLLALVGVLLAGCSSPKAKLPRFVFPAPPEQPKVEYVGNFYSEKNFKLGLGDEVSILSQLAGEGTPLYTFQSPFGVALDSTGRVYVTDFHLHNVRVFDFNKEYVELLAEEGDLQTPAGIVIDSQDRVYVADAGKAQVAVFDPDGLLLQTFGEKQLTRPSYLALNEALGRIYVSDGLSMQVTVYSMQGEFLFAFGGPGGGAGQFAAPSGMTFDRENRLYVADALNARIQVFEADGSFVRMFGERGDQPYQLESPADLFIAKDDTLWIIEGRRSDVQVRTLEGELLLVFGSGKPDSGPFGFSSPRSIYIDDKDRIFIAEMMGRRFSVWQYMTPEYLERTPYTEADRQALLDHIEKIRQERIAEKKRRREQ